MLNKIYKLSKTNAPQTSCLMIAQSLFVVALFFIYLVFISGDEFYNFNSRSAFLDHGHFSIISIYKFIQLISKNIKIIVFLGSKLYAMFKNGLAYEFIHGDILDLDSVKVIYQGGEGHIFFVFCYQWRLQPSVYIIGYFAKLISG